MAVLITLLSATPHRLKYLVAFDGAAGTDFTIANATLLADIPKASPLRPIFARTYVDTAAAQAAIERSAVVDFSYIVEALASQVTGFAFACGSDVDVNLLPVIAGEQQLAADQDMILMIEYRHSTPR